ncbi:MAG TPA: 2-phosphosulfolactate phosphatase [Tepidisphaeraceae bacterium]
MIDVRVVLLPSLLRPDDLAGRAVAVFDVLRATSSIASAIDQGAESVWLFDTLDGLRARAAEGGPGTLTAGEVACVRPDDFCFGNSPAAFADPRVEGKQILMATTNGTRALYAAAGAAALFTGAIVNARATAKALAASTLPVTLLCAGTDGAVAIEDLLGCAAVLARLPRTHSSNDAATIAARLWDTCGAEDVLLAALSASHGGRNVIAAGLADDVAFCARADVIDTAVAVHHHSGRLVASVWDG